MKITVDCSPFAVGVFRPIATSTGSGQGYVGGLTARRLAEGPEACAEVLVDILRRLGHEVELQHGPRTVATGGR